MKVRGGLGRGLDALLGTNRAESSDALRDIPPGEIRPNRFQPRKSFDETALAELRASIAEYGILVPLIVRRLNRGYELIAGERRWRAAAALQLPTVPALVRDADDRDTLEVAIVENLQREDLGPLEEAMGFAHLMEEYGFTQERLAERLGKSRPAVANTLRLLTLSDAIKALLADGSLSAGHARAVLMAPEERRLELARRAARDGLSVRVLERLAASPPASARKKARARGKAGDDEAFESQLRRRFGTHVALHRTGKGGRIEIRFSDNEDLIRIGELLAGETH